MRHLPSMPSGFLRLMRGLLLCMAIWVAATPAQGFSLALDSIAQWGRFPRFCINTYRWGDKFFNSYDSTYVVGTGYKFNAKVTMDSWMDTYTFALPDHKYIAMNSRPATSIGLYLTYLAVSVGYDINVSKIFTGHDEARRRFRFGFNCSLFAAEAYLMRNDVGTKLTCFGTYSRPEKMDYPFDGIDNSTWGVDAYYFFNHKKYSEAAAFNFSKIQKRSQGCFYTGFSIYWQQTTFDFSSLPEYMKIQLPSTWDNYTYHLDTRNYAIRFGYGYNWVFHRNWVLGVSESPIIGIRKGYVNSDIEKVSFSLYNRVRMSVIWNNKRWFAGVVGKLDTALVNDKETTYLGNVGSVEGVVGFRFNIW